MRRAFRRVVLPSRARILFVGRPPTRSAPENLLRVVMRAPQPGIEIEWNVAGTRPAACEDPFFRPCAAVCAASSPATWTTRGLPLANEPAGHRLFLEGGATP